MRPEGAVRTMGEPAVFSPAAPAAAMSNPLRSAASRRGPEPMPLRSALTCARVSNSVTGRATCYLRSRDLVVGRLCGG